MSSKLFALAWAALLACVSTPAKAQEPVPLCLTQFPPYVDADSPDGGVLTALATRALEQAGFAVVRHKMTWARALIQAEQGQCLLLALWRTPERDKIFAYSLPVAEMELGLFVRSDRAAQLREGDRVAVERDALVPPQLERRGFRLNPVAQPRQALEMLALRRVDGAFMERLSGEALIARFPDVLSQLHWNFDAVATMPTYMAAAKNRAPGAAWLRAIDDALQKNTTVTPSRRD